MIALLAFVLVFLVTLANAGSSSAAKVIKLGQILPLSGSSVLWGKQGLVLAEEAVKMFNDAGGIEINGEKYIYKVFTYDSGYTAKGGSGAANKLVKDDKVDFIIDSLGATVCAASQILTEPKKIITFTPAWGTVAEDANYTFRLDYTPAQTTAGGVSYIKKVHPNVKSVAMIGPNDEAGVVAMEHDRGVWSSMGFDVVFFDYYEKVVTEFYPIATKILRAKPDLIQTVSPRPGTHGPLLKAIYEQGYKGIIEGSHDPVTDVNTSGETRAEGLYSFTASAFGLPICSPTGNYLDELCIKKTGEALCFPAAVSWDGLAALHEALFRAQTFDPDILVSTLKADDFCFNSTYGISTFGGPKRVQIVGSTLVGQIKNGKLLVLDTSMSADAKERLSHCKGPLANYPEIPR